MFFSPDLIEAKLLKRYKRFLADVELKSGEIITVHCPNTGSMKNCIVPNSPCWLLDSNNPKRKYPLTWVIATTPNGSLACINTHFANTLVGEALEKNQIRQLKGYKTQKREQKYGESSRIDFLLSDHETNVSQSCYLEVKSVTLESEENRGLFPDAVSDRATKHLNELVAVKARGQRAVLLFCVQHSGINIVSPAAEIDPVYTETLKHAVDHGVEVYAYKTEISSSSMCIVEEISVEI